MKSLMLKYGVIKMLLLATLFSVLLFSFIFNSVTSDVDQTIFNEPLYWLGFGLISLASIGGLFFINLRKVVTPREEETTQILQDKEPEPPRSNNEDKNLVDLIMNTSENAILIVNNNGEIISHNHSSERLFGYSGAEFKFLKLENLIVEGVDQSKGVRKDKFTFPAKVLKSESGIQSERVTTVRVQDLTEELKKAQERIERSNLIESQNWLKTATAEVYNSTKGVTDLRELVSSITTVVSKELNVGVGLFYLNQGLFENENDQLKLYASYAFRKRKGMSTSYFPGEGLVGQCALEKKTIVVSDIPDNYIEIVSGMGNTVPREIVVTPILHDEELIGIMELGILKPWNELQLEFIDELVSQLEW